MKQPLSTRAQLDMLTEGLDGDPAPARLDLDLRTAPFTPERIRPLLAKTTVREITGAQFWVLLLFALFALTFVFWRYTGSLDGNDRGHGYCSRGRHAPASIRCRLKPSLSRLVVGVGAE